MKKGGEGKAKGKGGKRKGGKVHGKGTPEQSYWQS